MKTASKTTEPTLALEKAVTAKELFRAVLNPLRTPVLQLLEKSEEEWTVSDLYTHFETDQPTMSTHLRLLRENKLVKTRKEGSTVYYSINKETVAFVNDICQKVTDFLKPTK